MNKISEHSEMHVKALSDLRELADVDSSGKRYTIQHTLNNRRYSGTLDELSDYFSFEGTSEVTKLITTGSSDEIRLQHWKLV